MKNIKLISFVVILFFIIFLVACEKEGESVSGEGKIVKLRITAPLSGDSSYYGFQTKKGLDMSFADQQNFLRENGLGLDIQYEDNLGSPKNSVSNLNLFLAEDGIPLVISTNTYLTKPLISLVEQNKTNLLALVTGARDFAEGTEYVFRDAVLSYNEGRVLGNYLLKSKGYKRLATLVVNDDYGLSGVDGLNDELVEIGGEIVVQEVFENSDFDMRGQIIKIKQTSPDAVLLVGRENNIIVAVQQMNEMGISNEMIYSIDSFESPNVIEGLSGLAEGIEFVSSFYDLNDPQTKSLFERFNQEYGEDPGIYVIDAYSAGQYIVSSLVECGTTAEDINKCFTQKEFETIKGRISFDNKHDMDIELGIYEFVDGEKQLIQKVQ